MADRLNSERLRGFDNGWTDRQTDICDYRVAFVTEKSLKETLVHFLAAPSLLSLYGTGETGSKNFTLTPPSFDKGDKMYYLCELQINTALW